MSQRNAKWLVLLLIVCMIGILLSGCGVLDKLKAWKEGQVESENEEITPPVEGSELQVPAAEKKDEVVGKGKQIMLYFISADGSSLTKQERTISITESIARKTIEELIKGPDEGSGLLASLPEGTELLDINIKSDGLCIVDFSNDLVYNHPGGAQNEELTVYSIVNTLTQFSSVKEVKILVNGCEIETLAGHLDISETMSRNEDIITP